MRIKTLIVGTIICLECFVFPTPARAAARSGPVVAPAPQFSGGIAKLFGENAAFSANVDLQAKTANGPMTMPGKIAFLNGKSRFEMDSSQIKGGNMPAGAAEQMKKMGMSEMVSIALPDQKENYIIYPDLKAFAVVPFKQDAASESAEKTGIQKTELGKETVDGHPTTKCKVTFEDNQGTNQVATVWYASDLKDFPVKIEMTQHDMPITLVFKDVKLEKPEDSLFVPPADFTRYNDVGTLVRTTMMKRLAPPGALPVPEKEP